jgi:hypothetical protein
MSEVAVINTQTTLATPPVRPKIVINFDNIPQYLRDQKRWMNWHFGEYDVHKNKWRKTPNQSGWTESKNWLSFDEAKLNCEDEPGITGLGLVMRDSELVCFDVDELDIVGMKNSGKDPTTCGFSPIILNTVDCYAEKSVSGNGLHIFILDKDKLFKSRLAAHPVISGDCGHIEIFTLEDKRYVVVTGEVLQPERVEVRELTSHEKSEVLDWIKKCDGGLNQTKIFTQTAPLKNVPISADKYPFCIQNIISRLSSKQGVDHEKRILLVSFLHKIGLNVIDILTYFKNAEDYNQDTTAYQIGQIVEKGGYNYGCEKICNWINKDDTTPICDKKCKIETNPVSAYLLNLEEVDKLPDYIYPIIEKNNDISGYGIDYVKYSNFLAELYGVVFFNKQIYIYDTISHIYKPSINEVETHIRDTVVKYKIKSKLTQIIPELLKHLSSMGGYSEYPFNNVSDELPFLNGIVKICKNKIKIEGGKVNLDECITLLPHGKEHKFTYKINVTYNPYADVIRVRDIFEQWIPDQKDITKLLQAPAQALLQTQSRNSYKKVYVLQGEANSGKTSYFKLLIKIFTPEFVSSVSLQDMCEDRFVGGDLEGKILNICDDLQAIPLNTCENFKRITGDCSISIQRKYETKYRGWSGATTMFSCNYPPRCNSEVKKDAAFWGRLEYIRFPNSFNVNPKFYEDTYNEDFLSGVINLILETMLKIYMKGELLEKSEPGEVLMNWSTDADPICNFIEDFFVESVEDYDYSKSKMFDAYKQWFVLNVSDVKRMITSERAFTIAIQPYFSIADKNMKGENNIRERVRVYRGNKKLRDSKNNFEPELSQLKLS